MMIEPADYATLHWGFDPFNHLGDWVVVFDRWRIRRHLFRVERHLRAVSPSGLRSDQRQARLRYLDHLRVYRERGEFPVQHDLTQNLRPCFRDGAGRVCAVAHLMQMSGFASTVEHVALTQNSARVRRINPALLAEWLPGSGLSIDELALIQPSYLWRELLAGLVVALFSAVTLPLSVWGLTFFANQFMTDSLALKLLLVVPIVGMLALGLLGLFALLITIYVLVQLVRMIVLYLYRLARHEVE